MRPHSDSPVYDIIGNVLGDGIWNRGNLMVRFAHTLCVMFSDMELGISAVAESSIEKILQVLQSYTSSA